jgi:hypothetical protein
VAADRLACNPCRCDPRSAHNRREPATTTIEHTAPTWATDTRIDGNLLVHPRQPTTQPLVYDGRGRAYETQIALHREDKLTVDQDSHGVIVTPGPVILFVGEFEEMPVDQAPVLVAAVQELLDALNAEPQDGTPTV